MRRIGVSSYITRVKFSKVIVMESIKFVRENAQEREFAYEVRKRVRAYFKDNNKSIYGNFNMYLKSVVILGVYLVPFPRR